MENFIAIGFTTETYRIELAVFISEIALQAGSLLFPRAGQNTVAMACDRVRVCTALRPHRNVHVFCCLGHLSFEGKI